MGRLLLFDALEMKFRELKLRRDPKCPICGDHPTIKELIDYEQFCGIPVDKTLRAANPDEVTVQDLKKALDDPKRGIQTSRCPRPVRIRYAHIGDIPLIPMGELSQRFTELEPNAQLYIYCKTGVRSLTPPCDS